MDVADLFVAARDTATHKVCGTCGELRPLERFFKDGLDNKGNARYRRDCKDCYKKTRFQEAKMKKGRSNAKDSK